MASRKEIQSWMSSQNPESVMFTTKGMETGSLGHVPNPNALVLRVGENVLLTRMKEDTGNIVVMTTASIHFPSLHKKCRKKISS